ncbi:MAG: hypothetical protein KGL53_11175 [Elusimicrobia bacterium]|nr:hypothetical protein [Elusimicrobiota bacterium]
MRRKDEDTLMWAVVATAVGLLLLVLWLGGERLWDRLQSGPRPPSAARPSPAGASGEAVDHAPSSIPPLELAGVKAKPLVPPPPDQPASRPLPQLKPDRK